MAILRNASRKLFIIYATSAIITLFILTHKPLPKVHLLRNVLARETVRLERLMEEEILRRKEISKICSQLEKLTSADLSYSEICNNYVIQARPLIYQRLPHLRTNATNLRPIVVSPSNRTAVWMVMGLSTVMRDSSFYLVNTIGSLTENLSDADKERCLIVVLIAEVSRRQEFVEKILNQFQTYFSEHLRSGLLEVALVPEGFYPEFNDMKPSFDDTPQRAKWRTKQNLDYIYLMMYCQHRGKYYLQLEDDIAASPDYITKMEKHLNLDVPDWFMLEFSKLGFIGKLFHKQSLARIIEFLVLFYDDKPCDWLLHHVMELHSSCTSLLECKLRREYIKPSLFQHIGLHSSLSGKIQKVKANDFVGQTSFIKKSKGKNPAARTDTSLKTFSQLTLQNVYDFTSTEQDFFYWSYNPKADDYVSIEFTPPVCLDSYKIETGHESHPQDKLFNSTMEIQTQLSSLENETENGFTSVTAVANSSESEAPESGIISGIFGNNFNPVTTLRIRFLTDSPYWLIIRKISIIPCRESEVTTTQQANIVQHQLD